MKLGDNGEAFFVEENENSGVSLLIFNIISILFINFSVALLQDVQSFLFEIASFVIFSVPSASTFVHLPDSSGDS